MATNVNLIRDARLFFTSNVDSTYGTLSTQSNSYTVSNTREIKILDGLTFSQNTTTETVQLNESGESPVRGSRVFNTAIEPVDFSFSTYLCPAYVNNGASDTIDAEESVLWNAFAAKDAIGGTAPAWSSTTGTGEPGSIPVATLVFSNSEKIQLQKFALILVMVDATYVLEDCALEQVSIDFGIDAIATAQWSGRAISYRRLDTKISLGTASGSGGSITVSGGITGNAKSKLTATSTVPLRYLANKLSTVTIVDTKLTTGTTDDETWTVPITGGNLTLNNNLSYLTPATVGIVNKPITYFTGSRTMSGSLTAYLKIPTDSEKTTSTLLDNIITKSNSTDRPIYNLKISIGGSHTAETRVDVLVPTAMLSIPTINTEQVIGTTFNFTPQGSDSINSTDEISFKYYAATTT